MKEREAREIVGGSCGLRRGRLLQSKRFERPNEKRWMCAALRCDCRRLTRDSGRALSRKRKAATVERLTRACQLNCAFMFTEELEVPVSFITLHWREACGLPGCSTPCAEL